MASTPDKTSIRESKLGKRIIALRASLKMSQLELGKRVGTSAMSISRWESNNKRPPANYLIKFGILSTPDDCWIFWGQAGLTIEDVMRVMPRAKGGHL